MFEDLLGNVWVDGEERKWLLMDDRLRGWKRLL